MSGPLTGTLVVDLGRIVAAPTCCFYLASLGASVVRIEQPGGDMSWDVPPFLGPDGVHQGARRARDIPLGHAKRGRGKRSVVIDLHQAEGCDLLRRLAGQADVVVENFRPGVLDEMGIGYEAMLAANPALIWCAISGYGQDGPDRDTKAMDLVVQARSGLMAKTGFAEGPPAKAGIMAGDQVPAVFAALAIVAALGERDRTGRGRLIDIAMLDVLTSLIWDEPVDQYEDEQRPPRQGNADRRGVPHDVYRASDGWVAIVVTSQRQWTALCRLMGCPELAVELDTLAKRNQAADRVQAAVSGWMAEHPADWLDEQLRLAEIPGSAIRPPWAGRTDRTIAYRQLLQPLGHPDRPGWESPYLGPRLPVALDGIPVELPPAEPLGASTDRVLTDLLGLTAPELDGLHERGVVRSADADGQV